MILKKARSTVGFFLGALGGLYMMMFILFFQIAYSNEWQKPNYPSCDFYLEAEKVMNCRVTSPSYLLDYGYKYCEAYKKIANQFSQKGQIWLSQTGLCLQEMLYDNREKRFPTCQQLEDFAFDSHAICYKQYGICDLDFSDRYLLLDTIETTDLLSDKSFDQILNVTLTCLNKSPYEELQRKRLLPTP